MKDKKEFTAQVYTKAVNTPNHAQSVVLLPQMALDIYHKILGLKQGLKHKKWRDKKEFTAQASV